MPQKSADVTLYPAVKETVPAERVAFIGDVHIPYQDPVAVTLMLSFLRWWKPQFVYLIGDILDFYPP